MSGEAYQRGRHGHNWWYTTLEEGDYTLDDAKDGMELLGVICREMAWGKACDSCFACAKLRASAALDIWFEGDIKSAIAVARDRKQNCCERCGER